MLRSLFLAVEELFEPRFRRVVLLGVAITIAAFLVLWAAIGVALTRTTLFDLFWLESLVDLLGGLAALVLSWFLFPAAAIVAIGFFTDGLVHAIERDHYPDLPPVPDLPLSTQIVIGVKYGALSLVLTFLTLPFYLLAGFGHLLALGINGWLIGRSLFELVALRRLEPPKMRALRSKKSLFVFLAGLLIAFLTSIPLVNFVAPALGAAFMLHLVEVWRRSLAG
jgi:CysZ protein